MATATGGPSLLARWREVLRTSNPPAGRVDPVSRWLVLTRAAVLPMTLTSGAVAGLLAARDGDLQPGWFALALAGIVVAHAANNLTNDLFDSGTGLDTADYPRALYAPHPILAGLVTRRRLAAVALVLNVVDLAIGAVLVAVRGWPIAAFAVAGFVLSVAYTAPPLRLKARGLGEPTVLVVWGPLMVGGTYYAATGHLPAGVLLASVPYGLLCTAVLVGKHVDKLPWDAAAGVRTLPVILGEARALWLLRVLIGAFYPAVGVAVAVGAMGWPALAVVGALPTLVRIWGPIGRRRPETPPPGFPVWPLWHAALAFVHTRRAGALLVAGLALGVLVR